MKTSNFILLFYVLWILGCTKKEHRAEAVRDVTFNLGFTTWPKFTGLIPADKGYSTEVIYFADPASKKQIKIFSMEGEILDSIPLKEALNYLGNINSIYIISRDTIIVNSNYTNKIITINSQGKIWHKPNISSLIQDGNLNVYQIYGSNRANHKSNVHSILYWCSYQYNAFERLNNLEPTDYLENVRHYYKNAHKVPYVLKISGYFSQKPKLEFTNDNFYKKLTDTNIIHTGSLSFKTDINYTYIFPQFANKFIILNKNTNKIIKQVKISSAYTTLGYDLYEINKQTIQKLEALDNLYLNTKGQIFDVVYNLRAKQYCIILSHNITDEKEMKKQYPLNPHSSVIVCNEQFEEPREYAFTDGYRPWFNLMTSQGLMLAKNENPKSKIHDKITYTLFKFE